MKKEKEKDNIREMLFECLNFFLFSIILMFIVLVINFRFNYFFLLVFVVNIF